MMIYLWPDLKVEGRTPLSTGVLSMFHHALDGS
jgi:hypothetical protein